jgi:hypothetical protein
MSPRQFIPVSWAAGRWPTLALVLNLLAQAGVHAQAPGAGVHIKPPPAPGYTPFHLLIDCSPHGGPIPVFYLDGQRLDSIAGTKVNPSDIQGISLLTSDKAYVARLLGPEEGRRGVVFITTKAGQHTRAVHAFNQRLIRLSRRQP